MTSGYAKLDYEEPQTTSDGRNVWLRTSKVPLFNSYGGTLGLLGIYEDITARKKMETELEYRATHDALTSLANRTLLIDRLQQSFTPAARCARLP